MTKRTILALLVAVFALMASATDYVGTYSVTSGGYTNNNQTVTGTDIYDVTVHNFTVVLMGEVHTVGDVTFYSMIGSTDADGYTTVSGNTKLTLDDLVDMEDLGDLFGGFGDITALITGQQYPITFNGRFNYKYLTAQMSTNVVVSIMGMFELLNETVNITFSGESDEEPPVVYKTGDVNGDGQVDVSDVNVLVNIILDKESASAYGDRAYVTGGDKLIDIADINLVIEIMLNE